MKANNLKNIGMVAATDASGEVGVASAQQGLRGRIRSI